MKHDYSAHYMCLSMQCLLTRNYILLVQVRSYISKGFHESTLKVSIGNQIDTICSKKKVVLSFMLFLGIHYNLFKISFSLNIFHYEHI